MKRRLFLQFYLTIVASLALVVIGAGFMWRAIQDTSPAHSAFDFAGTIAAAVLPEASSPAAEQQAALERFARSLRTDLALFSAELTPIASAGAPLPSPRDWRDTGGWMHTHNGHAWAIALPDGRWLVMRMPRHAPPRHPALGLIGLLGAIALAVALGAYPIVRGITRRIERLEQGVVSLGAGHLSARVKVEGHDEVARLAESFNRSAERIEALVKAHKMLLANASHELRTPLSRIRLGIELMKNGPDAARERSLSDDIAELDQLIDEILLSSRLDANETLDVREDVDLLGLAAEECARYPSVALSGVPLNVTGDPRLLRRMIRNLLENAYRHGAPPVSVSVDRDGDVVRLAVSDGGTGIPAEEREAVFEPFRRIGGRGEATGTGLGLTLVRQIARRHRGEAVVEGGSEGRGACFKVSLPT